MGLAQRSEEGLAMKQPWLFFEWTRVSVFWRFAIVLLIVLTVLLLFPQASGVQTDSLEATATGTSSSHEFGILFGFLALFTLLFFSIGVLLWLAMKLKPSEVSMLSTIGNVRASRAMETNFSVLLPHDYLARAVGLTLVGSQRDFPVVEDERLVGMLLQGDLLMALKQDEDQIQVANVMRRQFPVVDFNDRMEDALNRLRTSGGHTLPVTHNTRLVGLMTMENAREYFKFGSANRANARIHDS
jgi:CBS domain-containing protein